jgi:hypothetical protein
VEQIFAAPNYIDVKIVENPQKFWRLSALQGYMVNLDGNIDIKLGISSGNSGTIRISHGW